MWQFLKILKVYNYILSELLDKALFPSLSILNYQLLHQQFSRNRHSFHLIILCINGMSLMFILETLHHDYILMRFLRIQEFLLLMFIYIQCEAK